MKAEHPIAEEVLDLARVALLRDETWMAYNDALYLIAKEDVCFLKRKMKR